MSAKSVFGKKLAAKRKALGMTQRDMCRIMGVTLRVYQYFESESSLDFYSDCMKVLGMKVVIVNEEDIM